MNLIVSRCTLFIKTRNLLLKYEAFKLGKRTLFHLDVLRVTTYLRDREVLEERLGNFKDKFLSKVTANVNEGKQIYTDDLRTLMLLTKDKEQLDLVFKALQLYKEQQQTSAFPSFFKHAEILLQMLYANQEVETAYKWFYNEEKSEVHPSCRNETCFVLMLDMLYKAGRYEDIVTLGMTFNQYIQESSWRVTVVYLGALYQIGTGDALKLLQAKLNECLDKESQLPSRCLMYSAMLAYKQEQYETMIEMLELPIFESNNHFFGKEVNMKLLAYIEVNRVDEAVQLLRSLLTSMTKSFPIVFPCVLEKMKDKVFRECEIEIKTDFHDIQKALIRGGFVRTDDLETNLNSLIGIKEIRTANQKMQGRNR